MANDLKDPKHPVWSLAEKAMVLFFGLMVVQWFNATNFDETELKVASQFLTFIGGYFGVKNLVSATRRPHEQSEPTDNNNSPQSS